MKHYTVNEVFYSVQGEGMRAGTANVFVRFSGCNLTCSKSGEAGFDCDTEFSSGMRYTVEELMRAVMKADEGAMCGWVILTGGEPGLQADEQLVRMLHGAGFKVAIETNGTVELPAGLDWVCVSPKSAEHTLRVSSANEVKYVRHSGQGIPKPVVQAEHKLLSPAYASFIAEDGSVHHKPHAGALAWCVELVKKHPDWRLSVQQHKTWGVR
jgi:7-carboxy-7-deazaguanine synthase